MPIGVANSMEKLFKRFLWGDQEGKRKVHLVAWSEVTKPKHKGGLGFIPIRVKNEALLCKWGWRFGLEKNALWVRLLSVKYGVANSNGWTLGEDVARAGSRVIKDWWKVTEGGTEVGLLFRKNLRLLVGKGDRTFFWEDLWLEDRPLKESFPRLFRATRNKQASVQDMVKVDRLGISWTFDFRRELRTFESDSLNELKAKLKEFKLDMESGDEWVWMGNPSGVFSVKSLCELTQHCLVGHFVPQAIIWKNLAPLRVQIFTWCGAKRRILTRLELNRRGLLGPDGDSFCPLCELAEESLDHLFVICPVAWRLWSRFINLFGISWVSPGSWEGLLESWSLARLHHRKKLVWNTIPAAVLWSIWREKNSRVF